MANRLYGIVAAVDISGGGVSKGKKKSAIVELLENGTLKIAFSVGAQRERLFRIKNISQLPHNVTESSGNYFLTFKDGTSIFMSCNLGGQLNQFHEFLQSAQQSFCQLDRQEVNSPQAGCGIDQGLSLFSAEDLVMIPVHWRIPNFESAVGNNNAVFVTKSIPQDLFPGIELKLSLIPMGRSQIFVRFAPVLSVKKSSATALTARYELAFSSASGAETVVQRLPLGQLDVWHVRGCSYRRDQVARLCSSDGTVILRGEIYVKSASISRVALRRMYENGTYSDFSIKVGDNSLNVHRSVLAEVSQEFKDRLNSNELEIKESTPDAVKAMLQFIYGDPLNFKGRGVLACAVLELAEKFKLPDLKRVCEDALIDLIDRSHVFAFALLAVRNKAEFLCNRAFEYVGRNISVFAERSEEWSSIKAKHPDVAMAICEFLLSEMQGRTAQSLEELGPDAKKAKSAFAAPADLVSATPSNPTAVVEIPVSFELPDDFFRLMHSSPPGYSLPPFKVSHDSLPGISWELIVYPNGKEKPSHVLVFMRAVCVSGKKSQATAPSGGYSLGLQKGDCSILSWKLGVQRFCKGEEHGPEELVESQSLLWPVFPRRPVTLCGKVLVEAASSRQIVHLRKLLESGDESDFVLKADGETFDVHKNILSQSSPTMSAMLRTGLREARNKEMEIGETTAEAVRAMLQFWYGDPLCFDGLEDLSADVFKLAARYQDDELRSLCENALIKMISRENAVHLTAFAVDQNCERLEKATLEFIKENARVILKEDSWTQFKEANLQLALSVAEKLVRT